MQVGSPETVWVQPHEHKRVGQCLADARTAAGLTQDELAAKLGKPQSFVSAFERGQRRVDLLEFLLISDALGANPHEIIDRIDSSAAPSRVGA